MISEVGLGDLMHENVSQIQTEEKVNVEFSLLVARSESHGFIHLSSGEYDKELFSPRQLFFPSLQHRQEVQKCT